jgi:PEP-CTERM motif
VKKTLIALCAAAGLMLGSTVAQAAEVTFDGYTNGCFTVGCVPPNTALPQSDDLGELTFDNTTFGGTSVGGNLAINLGTFSLVPVGNDTYNNTFNLRITFNMPSGISGGATSTYSSIVTGTTSSAAGQCNPSPTPCGSVTINFNNGPIPFTFTSGSTTGSFSLTIHDLTINAGQTDVALTGNITQAQQTTTTVVPEPATLALLAAGLLVSARRLRTQAGKDSAR